MYMATLDVQKHTVIETAHYRTKPMLFLGINLGKKSRPKVRLRNKYKL